MGFRRGNALPAAESLLGPGLRPSEPAALLRRGWAPGGAFPPPAAAAAAASSAAISPYQDVSRMYPSSRANSPARRRPTDRREARRASPLARLPAEPPLSRLNAALRRHNPHISQAALESLEGACWRA